MKRFLLAVFVVLLSSAVACANGFSVSGGAVFGNNKIDFVNGSEYFAAEEVGYYISGSGRLPGLPLSFTGSYSSFTIDEIEAHWDGDSELIPVEQTTSLLKVMVGYQPFAFPIALGAGYVSQVVDTAMGVVPKIPVSGVAVGAFGAFAVSEQADIAAEFYYVPAASFRAKIQGVTIDKADGSGWAFEVKGSYIITSQTAIEAGYRSTCFEPDDALLDSHSALRVGGLFLGAKYTF